MRDIIEDNVALELKYVQYSLVPESKEKKIETVDELKLVTVATDFAVLEVTRIVKASLRDSYELKVVESIKLFAKEGVDLTKALTLDILNKNKLRLTNGAISYISALISQITGSFGGYPIITAPGLSNDIEIIDDRN